MQLLQVIYGLDERQLVLSLIKTKTKQTISFKSSILGLINTAKAELNGHVILGFWKQIRDSLIPDKEIEDTIYIAKVRLLSWEFSLISLLVKMWQAWK